MDGLVLVSVLLATAVNCSGLCPANCQKGQSCTDPDNECPQCEPAYWGRHCENRTECIFDDKGKGYRGTKSTTKNGIVCQPWSSQVPHAHSYNGEENYCQNPDDDAGPWCYTINPYIRWMYCGVPYCTTCPVNCKIGQDCTDPDGECPECMPAYWGRYCEKRTECIFDGKGIGYRGTKNTTENGIVCQPWSSQVPHAHSYNGEENYCRNPDDGAAPWCYTMDPNVRWMYCGVPNCAFCPLNCKSGQNCTDQDGECPECMPAYWGRYCEQRTECIFDDKGKGYRGTKNTTKNGIVCQPWSSQVPHPHKYNGEENYCRNPDGDAAPWCYTMDPNVRWMYCGVSHCSATSTTTRQTSMTSEGSTSERTQTSSLPDSRNVTSTMCAVCRCIGNLSNVISRNLSIAEKTEILKETKRVLSVNKTTLSSYIRKKTCAQDDRTSASAIGYVGAIVIVSAFLILIGCDLLFLGKQCRK